MATKKTATRKSLKQLAESLPPAYELHRSGGEVVGKVSEELQDKHQLAKNPDAAIMADPAFPKGCVIMTDHVTIWKPHIYKHRVNHKVLVIGCWDEDVCYEERPYKEDGVILLCSDLLDYCSICTLHGEDLILCEEYRGEKDAEEDVCDVCFDVCHIGNIIIGL